MLIKFKSQHSRKVLWGLIFVIVPAFMLWGGLSYLNSRTKGFAGKIENRRITQQEFTKYLRLTQVGLLFQSPEAARTLSPEQIRSQAWRTYLFVWKAKKDKITITDQQVVETLANIFTRNDQFDRDWYFSIMKRRRINPREFEEYIRISLLIDKVLDTYVRQTPTEEEVLDLYKKENEKAKVAYLKIAYDTFTLPHEVTDEQISVFYEENKSQFKQEPKMKLKYVLLDKEKFPDVKETLVPLIKSLKTIDEIAKELHIQPTTTEYLTANSPIEGIGWEPDLVRAAFEAPLNAVSQIYDTSAGYVLFEKIETIASRTPPLAEIKNTVIGTYKNHLQKQQAKNYAENILKEITEKNIQGLESLSKKEHIEQGESDYFKFYDYIQGVGLYSNVSEAIFAAQSNEILPEVFPLPKAAYIIQLKEIVRYDSAKFEEEKTGYQEKISRQKFMVNQIQFLQSLQQESGLQIYANPQQ